MRLRENLRHMREVEQENRMNLERRTSQTRLIRTMRDTAYACLVISSSFPFLHHAETGKYLANGHNGIIEVLAPIVAAAGAYYYTRLYNKIKNK